jgi:hypothetical protein
LVGSAGWDEGIVRLHACVSVTWWGVRATRPLLGGEYTVGDLFRTTAHAFKYEAAAATHGSNAVQKVGLKAH